MNFKQFDDGSCDISFSDEEITILKKHKKLHLPAVSLKHMSNNFMKLIVDWNQKFDEETKRIVSKEGESIHTEKSNK